MMSTKARTFDSKHKLVTSYLFSPIILASIRLFFALYAFITALAVLLWEVVRLNSGKLTFFSYFTHLSYIGLLAYFSASGVQTLIFARQKDRKTGYPLQHWPRFLQFLHLLLYTTIVTYPIVVTIVFWTLLSSSDTFSTPYSAWSNISMHILNTAFAFFEVVCTNVAPLPWIHLPLTIVMLGGYLGVAYVTFATQGFYTYSFLDPKKEGGLLAAYNIGIAVAECTVFVVVRYVVVAREKYIGSNTMNQPLQMDEMYSVHGDIVPLHGTWG